MTAAQRAALALADESARRRAEETRARLERVVREAACGDDALHDAERAVRSHARVVVHFHPDRWGFRPITVAESLLADGEYRNQFETGLSSGSRTAFAGGARDEWERTLFGGTYHVPDSHPRERPRYGALELIRHPDGPIPRFGSCHLVLRPAVSARATFTFGGSERPDASERLGTLAHFGPVLAALLEEVAAGATTTVPWPPWVAATLGVPGITVCDLLTRLVRELPSPRPDPALGVPARVLDSCVEAHVHGPVDLRADVEALVVDPSFDGTPTGAVLDAIGERYAIPVRRHPGFRMRAADVPGDFRVPEMRPLAERIARGGVVDAAAIGDAERDLHARPERWADWAGGSLDEALQHLKQLWHVLVHHGIPILTPAG